MMLVPTDSLDIVPRRCLMALPTLFDAGMRFSGHLCRNHLEVHHVVARRCLMTLTAIIRRRRRVLILGNCPAIGRMALGAIAAKESLVPIVVGMAR